MNLLSAIFVLSAFGASFASNGPPNQDNEANGVETYEESMNQEVEIGLLRKQQHTGFICPRNWDHGGNIPHADKFNVSLIDAKRLGIDLRDCEPATWDSKELNCDNSLPDPYCYEELPTPEEVKEGNLPCGLVAAVREARWYGKPLELEECIN